MRASARCAPTTPLATAALALLALFVSSAALGAAPLGGDTLIGPFVAGMSVAEADTLASTLRLRWIGRDVHYAADSTLSLYEARDTTVRGVLVYGLTFERGRLHQVEVYRSKSPDEPWAFGAWLVGVMRSLAGSESLQRHGADERRCRPSADGSMITTILHLQDDAAIIIACTGAPRVGCQRC